MNPPDPASEPVAELVDRTRRLSAHLGREDLAARMAATSSRLAEPGVRILVVGEFKQGKSTLVNELLGHDVCPVDDDVATAVPTVVSHARDRTAVAYRRGDDGIELVGETIDPVDIALFVSEAGNPANAKSLVHVELGCPAPILAGGVVLVDTPGVGGLESAHGAVTIAAMTDADAVVFVTDASQEMTAPELAFLRHAHELCPTVLHVLSKIDLYPEWRRILAISTGHLQRAGLDGALVEISSSIHHIARARNDRSLLQESGFPALISTLQRQVIGPAERVVAAAALHDVRSTLDQLLGPRQSERSVLVDPAAASGLVDELTEARRRAEELKGRAARWQVTLNDGVADLNSAVDHDLRARTRRTLADADAALDEADPGEVWPEFEADLYARMTTHVVENFSMLSRRVDELVAEVERHFSDAEQELVGSVKVAAPTEALQGIAIQNAPELNTAGALSQGFTALRGGYSGPLMVSLAGTFLAPLAVVAAPLGLVAGVLMGRKALRDDRDRQLTARRQQAKQAVRKYVDEVSFQVTKDSRDTLREVQRELRDLFTARAEELARSTGEAVTAAQAAVKADEATRTARIRELDEEIRLVRQLDGRCRDLTAARRESAR